MPPTPPSADATPNDIVLYRDRWTPDTAALVSLSRMARMARPGRLLIRFATIQKQIAPTTVKMKNFQMRSASFEDRSPSPKYCPKNGIFWNAAAMPSSEANRAP